MASHGISRTAHEAKSRDAAAREREAKKLSEYLSHVDDLNAKREANDLSESALHLTKKVLQENPEYYTVWNYRRILLQQLQLRPFESSEALPKNAEEAKIAEDEKATADTQDCAAVTASLIAAHVSKLSLHLQEELTFLLPLLRSFPKCYWLWNHRLWTLTQSSLLPTQKALSLWTAELALVSHMLSLDARNFHGWAYRRIIISHLASMGQEVVDSEFEYTTASLQRVDGMRNYSAWHQRSKLMAQMVCGKGWNLQSRMDFLEEELERLKRALSTDPYDQSLWLFQAWLLRCNTVEEDCEGIARDMDRVTRIALVEEEIEWLKDLWGMNRECKYVLKALVGVVGILWRLRREERGVDEEDEGQGINEEAERTEVKGWIEELVKVDPMRMGRYADLERTVLQERC